METFIKLQMSEIRKKVNAMKTKESRVASITAQILKLLSEEATGDKLMLTINNSLHNTHSPTASKA